MEAVVQRAYGDADVLKIERIDRPVIGDDEVLVRVRAASINNADWVYTSGTPLIARIAFGLRAPRMIVRGKDVAGVVESVGAKVINFRFGDAVYGELESGTFAEFVAAPASRLARKPTNLSFQQAATVPLSGMTALLGLREAGSVKAGQSVLINGASGGVGTFAVQIAKALGADVTVAARARDAEFVRSLGTDHVIDNCRDASTLGTTRYDVIFDLIGNHTLTELLGALTPKGTLVRSIGNGGRVLGPVGLIFMTLARSPFVSQTLSPFVSRPDTFFTQSGSSQILDELRELIEFGQVTPVIDRAYPLAETSAAMRYFVEEHTRGKIAIDL